MAPKIETVVEAAERSTRLRPRPSLDFWRLAVGSILRMLDEPGWTDSRVQSAAFRRFVSTKRGLLDWAKATTRNESELRGLFVELLAADDEKRFADWLAALGVDPIDHAPAAEAQG